MKDCKEKGLRGIFCKSESDEKCVLLVNLKNYVGEGRKGPLSPVISRIEASGCANKEKCIDFIKNFDASLGKERK